MNFKHLTIIASLLFPSLVFAQTGPFASPNGYALYSNFAAGTTPAKEYLDGTTSSTKPNYSIIVSARSGAVGVFPAFTKTGNTWQSSSEWGNVDVALVNNAWSVTIDQNGANTQCLQSNGQLAEYDMDVTPNNLGLNPAYKTKTDFPTLDKLASLTMSGTVVVNVAKPAPGTPCRIDKAGANIGVVLIDNAVTPHQYMWYGVSITHVCAPDTALNPDTPYTNCLKAKPTSYWYWKGAGSSLSTNAAGVVTAKNFGVGDPIVKYNGSLVGTTPVTVSLNLLSRIDTLIGSGDYGIDSNLSHWQLSATSYGQSLWGRTQLSTTWTGFVPVWTLKQ